MSDLKSGAVIGGVAKWEIRRKDGTIERGEDHNIVVDNGVNVTLNNLFNQGTEYSTWYMGFLNNYTPVAGSTMTNFGGNEFTAYDEAARQSYTPNGASTAKLISNSSAPVVITCSTDSSTIYGVFLASSSTKSETASQALSAILFSSAKGLDDGETLTVTYEFGAADDGV